MKWRHWAVLIVLLLLNYIIFSTALTQLARQRLPQARPVRTLRPTFSVTESNPIAWKVLPTSTTRPSPTPASPTPTLTSSPAPTSTAEDAPEASATGSEPTATKRPTKTPRPPTATPPAESVLHVVRRGETLSEIAKAYGVTSQAIVEANDIENPNRIITGQKLIIPSPKQTPTPRPTNTPTANP